MGGAPTERGAVEVYCKGDGKKYREIWMEDGRGDIFESSLGLLSRERSKG